MQNPEFDEAALALGRVVHFFEGVGARPEAALVTAHGDHNRVSLRVFGAAWERSRTGVRRLEDAADVPETYTGGFWSWTPLDALLLRFLYPTDGSKWSTLMDDAELRRHMGGNPLVVTSTARRN